MAIRQILKRIAFTQDHEDLVNHLKPFAGHEWEGKLPGKVRGLERNEMS